jgi:uncharacterized phage protein (predicted DNA packaging)
MKQYLRVDFDDDDELIENAIFSAESLCADITRLPADELAASDNAKVAVLYAVAYIYEHREDADFHELTMSLRYLLFGIRKEEF